MKKNSNFSQFSQLYNFVDVKAEYMGYTTDVFRSTSKFFDRRSVATKKFDDLSKEDRIELINQLNKILSRRDWYKHASFRKYVLRAAKDVLEYTREKGALEGATIVADIILENEKLISYEFSQIKQGYDTVILRALSLLRSIENETSSSIGTAVSQLQNDMEQSLHIAKQHI